MRDVRVDVLAERDLARKVRDAERLLSEDAKDEYRNTYNCEAVNLARSGHWAEAEAAARTGYAILTRTLPAQSWNAIWSERTIGLALLRQGKLAEAETHSRTSYET